MRTLTEALTAAQKQAQRHPYVQLKVREFIGEAPRPYWSRLYTGTEPDETHALAVPEDGSLIRLRIGEAGGATLFRQRVTTPNASSDYTPWTSFRTISRLCAISQYGANLIAFTVDNTTPTEIYKSESTDNGATWGAWSLLATAAGTVATIAAASKIDGDTVLFFSVGAILYRLKRTAGTWGAITAWGNTVNTITGIAAHYNLDWNLVLTGNAVTTTNPTVWQLLFGDGYGATANTFSALQVITPTTAGANVIFDSPFGVYAVQSWTSYNENYIGTGGYNRPYVGFSIGSYVDNARQEPVPFNQTTNMGLALAYLSPYIWATTPFGVWRADISAPLLNLSADILAFTIEERPLHYEITITLRNDHKKYNNPGVGSIAALRIGAQVNLAPGLRKPGQAPSVIDQFWAQIEGWEHYAGPEKQTFTLHCTGPWTMLRRWRARTSYQWAAGALNVFQLATFILARAGFSYTTSSSSSQLVNLYPAFTIHPNEDGISAITRLFEKVEDQLRVNQGQPISVYPQASGAVDYAYGGTPGQNHAIIRTAALEQAREVNYVHTLAGATLGEALDADSLLLLYDRRQVIQDKALATEAEADARASSVLRKALFPTLAGYIIVPANIAQELWDLVTITEPRIGLTAAKRRVLGLKLTYSTSPPKYEHQVLLGAP